MTTKTKTHFVCQSCGATHTKWQGQCQGCQEWNTIQEETASPSNHQYAGETSAPTRLNDIPLSALDRHTTHHAEFDRVLGGGLVPGSVILLGGDPGIGKSTLLLQILSALHDHQPLYVTGEESLSQIALRAKRLGLPMDTLTLLAETQVERILAVAQKIKPTFLVIDSIQTMQTMHITAAAGSVSQVREATARLVQFAKQQQVTILVIGHVTKEGAIAGPRVLEHMVDTVLYFEGQTHNRYRMIRAVKNRFGALHEMALFAMTEMGLKAVSNPSAIFLSRDKQQRPGTCVTATWEGSRPLLIELQALLDTSHINQPRRVTVGLDHNRLAMLLAVLHRHGGLATYDQDVFLNIVGGLKVNETSADLAVIAAVVSSLKNQPIPSNWLFFGEVGLAGEIRPIPYGTERLNEAWKQGFTQAIIPSANAPKSTPGHQKVLAIDHLSQLIDAVHS